MKASHFLVFCNFTIHFRQCNLSNLISMSSSSSTNITRLDKNEKQKWSVRDSKVNLAALLNDPRKSRRDYDLFTKTWGETFRDLPPGSKIRRSKWIPNVQKGHFSEYLSHTSDQFLRHDSQSIENLRKSESEDSDLTENSEIVSSTTIKSAVNAQQERDAIMKTRIALDTLPKLFLRTDFNMGNAHVFASVLKVNNTNNETRSEENICRHGMSSSKLLQEKLNHYLDRVEMAIVRQISLQSDAFFKAMESHEELDDYLNKTMSSVKKLIEKVKAVKKNIVVNSLQILNLHRTRVNSVKLLEKLQMMITVHQTQPTIQLLLSTSEYAGSLDLIKTTQEVLHQELAGLHCFRHLSSQLTEIERVIGQMMRQEMDECLRSEIHRSITEGHFCQDPHRLTAVTLGLIKQGQFEFLQEFREEIEVAIKTIIKNTVSDAVPDVDDEKVETLASRMRMLDFTDWIALLNTLCDNQIILLRRVKSILDVLVGVTRESAARGDLYRAPRIRKVQHGRARRRLHSNSFTSKQTPSQKGKTETNLNPFVDSTSNSDSYEDKLNPFENASLKGSDSSNPFLSDHKSPARSAKSNGDVDAFNPFIDELSDQNDLGESLMDGLASYEDELITSAADSFVGTHERVNSASAEASSSQEVSDQEQSEEVTVEEGLTTEECDNFIISLKDLLVWTSAFQQDRCVKVLIAKGKDNSLDRLSSGDFLKLAKAIERFAKKSEEIILKDNDLNDGQANSLIQPRLSGPLRGALQTQAGRFVTRFHDERRNKLSLILDNEVWKQAEVPTELSFLLQNMVHGNMSPGDSAVRKSKMANGDASHTEHPSASEYLELDGEKYVVVGTVLILLKMVSEYCKCSDDLPASTPDLIHRLRDLLTMFNSRTCQLFIGAGALQLVGLKTISTKHLALASRCLQLVLHCLPAIRHHFERKLLQINQSSDSKPNKHKGVLRHFDHITKDYQNHVIEVESKLTSIVLSVVERHLSMWEVKAPVPSPSFRNICKQISKFYDTVSSLLPQNQLCGILQNLNIEFKKRLRILLQRFGVRNDGGPQHGLVTSDLTFYESNIKNLKGMEKVNLKLNSVWS